VKHKKEIRVGRRRIYMSLKHEIPAKIASAKNLQNRLLESWANYPFFSTSKIMHSKPV